MFSDVSITGAHPPEPVHAGANEFEQEWLNVGQAVVRCAELGLTRTPKTIRKWAERSSGLPDGDVVARKEDTLWGYRWLIESTSLKRKVEEDIQFQGANQAEPVRTIPQLEASPEAEKPFVVQSDQSAHPPEPVHASANGFTPTDIENPEGNPGEPGVHQPEPVQTRSDMETILDEVRARMSDKDQEISFLRDQLADAQAEVTRRAASTDEALKTIDRVVRSFEMQAEANKALALRGTAQPKTEASDEPIRYSSEAVDTASRRQDIRRV